MTDNKLKTFLFITNLILAYILLLKFNVNDDPEHSSKFYDSLMYLEYSILQSYELNGKEIPLLNDKIQIQNKYLCILVYNTKDCDVCLKREIKNIQEISKKIDNDNVKVLLFDDNLKSSTIFRKINNLPCEVIQMKSDYFYLYFGESVSSPFVLIVDENMRIINSFFPSQEVPHYSDIFYRYVKSKFGEFSKNKHN